MSKRWSNAKLINFKPGDFVAIVKRRSSEQQLNAYKTEQEKKQNADKTEEEEEEQKLDTEKKVPKIVQYTVVSFHGCGQYIVTDGVKQLCANAYDLRLWNNRHNQ